MRDTQQLRSDTYHPFSTTSDSIRNPDHPSSVGLHSEEAAALYRTHVSAFVLSVPGDTIRDRPQHFFQTPISVQDEMLRIYGSAFLVCVICFSLSPIVYLWYSGVHVEKICEDLLAIEQVVENDYPVPSYFKSQRGGYRCLKFRLCRSSTCN